MTLIAFDTMGMLHRAFHAGPGFVSNGKAVGALGDFWSWAHRVLTLIASPRDLAAFAWEGGRTFRHDLFPEYKGQRVEKPRELTWQIEEARRMIEASGIDIVQASGFEADDVLATLAYQRHARGQETVIVSSDKDMMQCLPYARLFGWIRTPYTTDDGRPWEKDILREITVEDCRAKFGCEPDLVTTYLAIAGDQSDNIKGVPGLGDKAARGFIARFGDLEACIAGAPSLENARVRDLMLSNVESARLSLRLATIATDAPVVEPWSTVGDIDWAGIVATLRAHGCVSAPDRIERHLRGIAA